jgi:hypothetical protein
MDNDELRELALADIAAITVGLETLRRASPDGRWPGAPSPATTPAEKAWDQVNAALAALEQRLEQLHPAAGPAPGM